MDETKHACIDCDNFCFEGPQPDQPYPEFWCAKGKWDGMETLDSIYEEVECKDFVNKKKKEGKG